MEELIPVSVIVPKAQVAALYRFTAQLLDPNARAGALPVEPVRVEPPGQAATVPVQVEIKPSDPDRFVQKVVPPPAPDPNAQPSSVIQPKAEAKSQPKPETAPQPQGDVVQPKPPVTPEQAAANKVATFQNCHNAKDVVAVLMSVEGRKTFEEVLERFREVRKAGICKAAEVIPEDKVEQRVRINFEALKDAPF